MDLFTIDYSLVIKTDAAMLLPGLQAPVVIPDLLQCGTQRGSKQKGFRFTGTTTGQAKQDRKVDKRPHTCLSGEPEGNFTGHLPHHLFLF